MYNLASKIILALALSTGSIAQVTETVTPNAAEYAQIKSDIASYHSALTTESLYIAAESYLKDHSTSVPPIGLQLYTASWSQGISSLNALITTTFAPDFPTVVAQLYKSALNEQASIINEDISEGEASTITSAPLTTGTGSAGSSGNNTSFSNTNTPSISSGTPTSTASAGATSSGAANAQIIVNGMMIAAGLGVAVLL